MVGWGCWRGERLVRLSSWVWLGEQQAVAKVRAASAPPSSVLGFCRRTRDCVFDRDTLQCVTV